MPVDYLTGDEIERLHDDLTRVSNGVSGTLRPGTAGAIAMSAQYCEDQSLEGLAAFYMSRIAKAHLFTDMNKRTAYFSGRLFLMKNGADFNGQDPAEAASQMEAIAQQPTVEAAYTLAKEACTRDFVPGQPRFDYKSFHRVVIKSIGVAHYLSDM